jgi:hypothetical protein
MYNNVLNYLSHILSPLEKVCAVAKCSTTYQEMMLSMDPDQDRVVNGSDRIRILIAGYSLVVVISV